MKGFVRVCLIAVLSSLVLVSAPPASANVGDAWVFQKNWSDRTNSTFLLQNSLSTIGTWRGGSGLNTNECDAANPAAGDNVGGWLPSGAYTIQGYSNNWPGSDVQGPVLILPNKLCSNGSTWRTELFVHSSYPWSVGHYSSLACIKLSNSGGGASGATGDIRSAVNLYISRGQPTYLSVQ